MKGPDSMAEATEVGMGRPFGARRIDRREVFGWAMFDFANSSFTTVIVTALFPVYFTKVVAPGPTGDWYYSVAGALALLVVILISPLLGALADFSAGKKKFLLASYLACVVFTALLWFVGPGDVVLGMVLFAIAKVFFSTGENLVAAFLPDIAPPEDMGKVSGFAWSLGFLGGIACLMMCRPYTAGLTDAAQADTTRMIPLVVAGFFLVAGIPTFLFVKQRGTARPLLHGETYLGVGMQRLSETVKHVRQLKQLSRFLLVFTAYNAGLSVVVYFTSIYAEAELGFTPDEIMTFFLVINLVAAAGAFGFGVLQDKIGARKAINLTLILWMIGILMAWASTEKSTFWVVGVIAGLALGATQSGSRALVGEFSPPSRSAEFFGFWGLFWKLSEAIGPLAFGFLSASMGRRPAILATLGFFVVGFLGMLFVDEEAGREEAVAYELATRAEEAEMDSQTVIGRRAPF